MARVAVVLMLLALVACKPPAPALDPRAESIAHEFFDDVARGADLEAEPHLAHELKNPTSEQEITEFKAVIPAEPYRSMELRSSETKTDSTGTTTSLMQVYHYADKALVVQTALFKSPAGVDPVIVGFKVEAHDNAS
jgi:hypothetical protein